MLSPALDPPIASLSFDPPCLYQLRDTRSRYADQGREKCSFLLGSSHRCCFQAIAVGYSDLHLQW